MAAPVAQRKDFEVILTVKMKTRHPTKGQLILEVNFRRSVIIAEL